MQAQECHRICKFNLKNVSKFRRKRNSFFDLETGKTGNILAQYSVIHNLFANIPQAVEALTIGSRT